MNAIDDWLQRQWAIKPEAFSVMVEGAAIACRGWNLGANALPGVVLVHGFRAHAHWWDHIAPSLAERFRVVAISFSGMGDSARRNHYSRGQLGREITGVAQACGFAQAVVIAHSFGAVPALLAAGSQAELISRLVVIDSGLKPQDEPAHEMEIHPRRTYPSLDAALERFRLTPDGPWSVPLVRDYIARHSIRQDGDGWTWKFDPDQGLSLNEDTQRMNLPPVHIPVDVIRAEHSSVMLAPNLAELVRITTDLGHPIVIPASEHHIMIDQPVALVGALRALLANDRKA
jgi:pimeloyl-ACP methyl ester carboxylesterase